MNVESERDGKQKMRSRVFVKLIAREAAPATIAVWSRALRRRLLVLVLLPLACAGPAERAGGRQGAGRMSGLGVVPHGVDVANALAVADAQAGGQKQLIAGTQATILCCTCGAPMVWNPAAMCSNCIRTRTDITEGIPKSVPLQACRNCGRYLNPPRAWTTCQPESKELMQICLKRVKGLNKVKLIDASFIWTEPHSRRLKLKLTIQKEVFSGVILQQVFVVEMVIHNFQCNNCHMVAAQNTWRAAVQVRQKVDHKRTFYLLEQLILKYKAHQQCVSVKEQPDGVDFYFLCRHHAMKFQEFIVGVVPCRKKVASEQLISEDLNNNRINAKWTFSAEIVPVCKDDVICIHPQQYRQQGNLGPLLLCTGVTASLKLIDPVTMQRGELNQDNYFRHPRPALMTSNMAIEYTVLDVELTGKSSGKLLQAELTLARSRDLGANDVRFQVLSHLGAILQAGDIVMGYDMTAAVYNEADTKEWPKLVMPDVIVFKKVYPEHRRRSRMWKLRALIKEEEEGTYKSLHKTQDKDYEAFLEDVDMDPEMRQRLNVYKDPAHFRIADDGQVVAPPRMAAAPDLADPAAPHIPDAGADLGLIGLEEMLDDLVLGDDEEVNVGEEAFDEEGEDEDGGGTGPLKADSGKKAASSRAKPY